MTTTYPYIICAEYAVITKVQHTSTNRLASQVRRLLGHLFDRLALLDQACRNTPSCCNQSVKMLQWVAISLPCRIIARQTLRGGVSCGEKLKMFNPQHQDSRGAGSLHLHPHGTGPTDHCSAQHQHQALTCGGPAATRSCQGSEAMAGGTTTNITH